MALRMREIPMLDLSLIKDILSWLFLFIGALFCLIGSLGMVRFPDFFTRLHAASLIDTVGIGFIFLGLMIQTGFTLNTAKLLIILILMFFLSPAVTHAAARSALYAKIKPRLHKGEDSLPTH